MQFQFAIHAQEYELFAPGAFERTIGSEVPFRMPDGTTKVGTVVAVVVAPTTASVTVSMDGDLDELSRPFVPGSVGFI
jgi:hypothetical protein